jgi:hypothetical protein
MKKHINDEPYTFAKEKQNPLKEWIDIAEKCIKNNVKLSFPITVVSLTKTESQSAFIKLIGLTSYENNYNEDIWSHIWQNWDPNWGTLASPQIDAGRPNGKQYINYFFLSFMEKRYMTYVCLAEAFKHEKIANLKELSVPNFNCLEQYEELMENHWSYKLLCILKNAVGINLKDFNWPEKDLFEIIISDDFKKTIENKKNNSWNLKSIKHILTITEKINSFIETQENAELNHWSICYNQEMSWYNQNISFKPDMPPVNRPFIFNNNSYDKNINWLSIKSFWAKKIASYSHSLLFSGIIEKFLENGKKYLFFKENAPGDKQNIEYMVQLFEPELKSKWEKEYLSTIITITNNKTKQKTRI